MDMKTDEKELQPRVWQAALAGLLHEAQIVVPDQFGQTDWTELVNSSSLLSAGETEDVGSAKERVLVSIFDRIALDSRGPRAEHFLPLAPLRLERGVLFPTQEQSRDERGNAYETLREKLENAARENSADAQTYLEHMLAAMQRLTWCVPSAYYHSIPDMSLYDHSRMTAALAVCLADWDENKVRELLGAVRRDFQNHAQPGDDALLNQDAALLIGGDISGVQDFIYTLTSQDAAKTLRGRSFYLQLLGEAVLRFVLRELGLPYTNVIYSGGGNFFLLAPVSAEKELPHIRRAVAEKLLTHHGSAMYLAIGATPVPVRGFKRGQFKTHWDRMHREIGKAKQRRYQELDGDLYARVFEPQAHGGNRDKACGICGLEDESVPQGEGVEKRCALCDSFIQLGKELTHADFVALGFSESQKTEKYDAANALRAFGMQFEFAKAEDKSITFLAKPERAVIWALDDLKDGQTFPPVRDVPTARMTRYLVNRIPMVRDRQEAEEINKKLSAAERKEDAAKPGEPKTFTHLQVQSDGIPRLGVLRMDVDNLGDLFSKGFGEDKENIATLARISTLSFQLGLFFDGWVKKICAEPEYENRVYAVYAGGDDVFLIAPWSIVPELAQRIVRDLADYTAHNPDVHLSAGMTFIHGKYPVYQAAEDAHDALEQAKHIDEGKNAFSFLGQAWKWSEFDKVYAKYVRLEKLVRDKKQDGLGAQQAILQTFRQFALMEADAAKRNKKPVWGKWMWLGAYKLTRDAERAKEPLKGELIKLRDELHITNYQEIAQWGAAARWVQLFVREK